jgi:Protein of unknown function (DUF4435)
MKSYIDNDSKKNEIRMLLRHPSSKGKVIVLLEGDTDIRLFRSLLNKETVKIETAVGKSDVIVIIRELMLEGEHSDQILGICDADFSHIIETDMDFNNVFLTDAHDAEMMILESPATKALIAEYALDEKSHTLLTEGLIHATVNAAFVLGIFRMINLIDDLNINFKGLFFDLFSSINGLNIDLDLEKLVNTLIERSQRIPGHANKEYLLDRYSEFSFNKTDYFQICCGHDVTKFITFVLRQRELSNDANMSQEKVERSLRLSYTLEFFMETKLYNSLFNWQTIHSKVLFVS